MTVIREVINRFRQETAGQDLIEYALLAAFIGIAAAGATGLVGTELNDWYTALSVSISTIPN